MINKLKQNKNLIMITILGLVILFAFYGLGRASTNDELSKQKKAITALEKSEKQAQADKTYAESRLETVKGEKTNIQAKLIVCQKATRESSEYILLSNEVISKAIDGTTDVNAWEQLAQGSNNLATLANDTKLCLG